MICGYRIYWKNICRRESENTLYAGSSYGCINAKIYYFGRYWGKSVRDKIGGKGVHFFT